MKKFLLASVFVAVAGAAQAHFVFVVPAAKDPAQALVVFSDTLEPDEGVTMTKFRGLKLKVKDEAGKVSEVAFEEDKHVFKVTVPGAGARVVFGSVDYGVIAKSAAKPYRLTYHPKAILGGLTGNGSKLPDETPMEVAVDVGGGKVKFQMLGKGKPLAAVDGTVILPDGSKEKVKSDKDGYTPAFKAAGRYGVYAWHMEAKAGEHDGKKYDEVKHYATLVVDFAK